MDFIKNLFFKEQPWLKNLSRLIVVIGAGLVGINAECLDPANAMLDICKQASVAHGYYMMIAGWLGLEVGAYKRR